MLPLAPKAQAVMADPWVIRCGAVTAAFEGALFVPGMHLALHNKTLPWDVKHIEAHSARSHVIEGVRV